MVSTTVNSRPDPFRLTPIDALRGAVMVIMALDHTRDFIHAGAMVFPPEDLTRTTPAIFLTRWITHFCAPTFFFLAGMGAALRGERERSRARLARFLWTRGLFLIALELTVMRLAMNFTFAPQYPVILLILWALGFAMIALAALVFLPRPALAVVSASLILLHNLLDPIRPAAFGPLAPLWQVVHQPGLFVLGGQPFVVGYPVLPWVGVMAAGFLAGPLMRRPAGDRRRLLLLAGAAITMAFVVVRVLNVYGDPSRWSARSTLVMTVLSFLRTTKYPPSLAFVLMTIGPALLMLRWLDRRDLGRDHPLVVIGRVPLFFYVVHFWLIHIVEAALAWIRYGAASLNFLFMPLPDMGGAPERFPPSFGYPLWAAYLVWAGVIVALYPLCRWFGGVKARHRSAWSSYV